MADDEEIVITPVPSLIATLLCAELDKKSPLTREEVESITDKCPCIAMPRYALDEVERARGYIDIDPENAWARWQEVRVGLHESAGDEEGRSGTEGSSSGSDPST